MTIGEFYKYFNERLKSIYEERESINITDWIFESIASITRLDRILKKQKALNHSAIKQLNEALDQLLQHKPVQYVLGEAWFYKMKLNVNEHVLIPRPETEELVEWVVEDVRSTIYDVRGKSPVNIIHQTSDIVYILDIGTGSGCIAVALKKELPDTELTAIDISSDALQVAKENAQDQDVEIGFAQLDFLNEELWSSLPHFNIIICNPPYIPENEKNRLAKNVVEHEPHIALFVNDNDPFIFYRKIAAFAGKHLKQNGKIFVEVHDEYAKEVQQIFLDENFEPEIKKDVYGKDRMIQACRSNKIL